MGRHKQPGIVESLLDACTDYALAHGLPDRLEEFARGTGTSSRMLVYHFKTRDGLRAAVLRRARARQRDMFGDLMRLQQDVPYLDTLRVAWRQIAGDRGRPFLRMFGRLREDAEQQLWPQFQREATTDWLGPLEEGLVSAGLPDYSTLVLAVIRGLIMDLEATDDRGRVDRAFQDFIETLDMRSMT